MLWPLGFRGFSARRAFSRIYRRRTWHARESISGEGSDLSRTTVIRSRLVPLLRRFDIRSILDAGCGDFHWMREIPLDGVTYAGVDVVDEVIAHNRRRYQDPPRRVFERMDVARDDLPDADLVLCRDCLVHMPLSHAVAAIQNFRRGGARYLLATTFDGTTVNRDAVMGDWRPLNLSLSPFDLGKPLLLLRERLDVAEHRDKALGLWALK